MKIIVNSTPIIALSLINQLDLLNQLDFEHIIPDKKHNWLNQSDNDFYQLLPLIDKDVKSAIMVRTTVPTMTFIEMGVHINKARKNNLFFEVNNGNIIFGGDC